jgi:hypothetical protein
VPAQRREERVRLVGVDHPRQGPWCPDQRHPAHRPGTVTAQRQPARHRVTHHRRVTAYQQVLIQTSDGGQATLDRAGRQTPFAVLDAHHRRAASRLALRRDERQHVGGVDLNRVLADDREEDLQIERARQHRVRPRPRRDQLQERIQQRMPHTNNLATIAYRRADQTRIEAHGNPSRVAVTPGRSDRPATARITRIS